MRLSGQYAQEGFRLHHPLSGCRLTLRLLCEVLLLGDELKTKSGIGGVISRLGGDGLRDELPWELTVR
jgi:hypothetical protein